MPGPYVYNGIAKDAPSPRDWAPGSRMLTTDVPAPGKVREWKTDGLNWTMVDSGTSGIDPALPPFGADPTGAVDARPAFQAALALADNDLAPGFDTKGRDALRPAPGRYKMSPWTGASTGLSIVNDGESNRVVLAMDHTGIAAETAMFTFNVADSNQQSALVSRGRFEGINLDGRSSNKSMHVGGPHEVHGLRYSNPGSSQRAHSLERVHISNFNGWCIVADDNFHQFRWDDVKALQSKRGVKLANATDSKFLRLGIGGIEYEGLVVESSTTNMFEESDVWVPGNGDWKGQYYVQLIGGYGHRFMNSDFNATILLSGSNNNNSDTNDTRKRMLQHVFSGCTLKATTDMSAGYATHSGDGDAANYQQTDGTYAPQAIFTLLDAGGLSLTNGTSFGFGSITMINSGADIPNDVAAARPEYVARFLSANQTSKLGLMADRRGLVTVDESVNFCHFQPVIENLGATDSPSQPYNLRKPWPIFKRRITNDDRFLVGPFLKIVPINKNIELFAGKNYGPRYVALKGQTIPVVYHPLAYLAMSLTVHLQDGVTNFTLPDLADISTDYCWALRYW